jgi:hypothetical protein
VELIDRIAAPPEVDGVRRLARRVAPFGAVRAVVESMNGAHFVHDTLGEDGMRGLALHGRAPAQAT